MSRTAFIYIGALIILGFTHVPDYSYAEAPKSIGQTVYVSAYSYVRIGPGRNPRKVSMSANLSIRNTDDKHPITILSVAYYNTEGAKIRDFVPNQFAIKPLATNDFYIGVEDKTGGSGANFIVKWRSRTPVYPPVIEALHFSYTGKLTLAIATQNSQLTSLSELRILAIWEWLTPERRLNSR